MPAMGIGYCIALGTYMYSIPFAKFGDSKCQWQYQFKIIINVSVKSQTSNNDENNGSKNTKKRSRDDSNDKENEPQNEGPNPPKRGCPSRSLEVPRPWRDHCEYMYCTVVFVHPNFRFQTHPLRQCCYRRDLLAIDPDLQLYSECVLALQDVQQFWRSRPVNCDVRLMYTVYHNNCYLISI